MTDIYAVNKLIVTVTCRRSVFLHEHSRKIILPQAKENYCIERCGFSPTPLLSYRSCQSVTLHNSRNLPYM